jgi:hypothetical protein
MSRTAQHHAEWLSLVETSGPFLSLPVLLRVFPQELEGRDPERAARLREAYADWLERGPKIAAVHQAWVRHVLTDLLGYSPEFQLEGQAIPPGLEARFPVHGETLRPDLVLRHRDAAAKPCLLIKAYPPGQNLAKAVAGSRWNAAPGTRMMELLHAVDQPLGLVTNGEQWMLVYAPRGETTGFASWYADLWMQEPLTLRAFHSLLRQHRFIGVAEADTLAALLAESAKDQQEVTDQLGKQVRQAVEVLVQALDHIDADTQRTLLADIAEKDIYNSALTVMMRLVFLFSAEERELLPLNDAFYAENYAASTLSAQLRERADQFGEEVLERRHDAWGRLLATFRAVHGGVLHDRLQLPAYGGSLFDPDRYPFLEGRSADTRWRYTPSKPLPINNRVVLHLLEALQFLRIKVKGAGAERRRLSFRALDIEQIGHVYEGLLDHTARRAASVVLGLDGKNEPELPLATLEAKAAEGQEKLVEFLTEETGKSAKAVTKALAAPVPDEFALQHACGNELRLVERVRPFADFIRADSFGRLLVIPPGSLYVTSGSDRRSTGTHYTPRSLTEPVVRHTLEPLVYVGPAEGLPQDQWTLKNPKELLALKVCDLAMGSGAFLVQACRYLAERLVEAWERAEREHPDQVLVTPDGELSAASPAERLLPPDAAERLALARRYVADRCLYGVDINPMAVEMAKLSLWLITLQRDRPFTFLDHAFKCGDSLLGVTSVKQIENFSLRPGEQQVTFATSNLFRYIEAAAAKRRELETLPSNDNGQIATKTRLHAEAESATAKVKALADLLIALELRGLDGIDYTHKRAEEAEKAQQLLQRDADNKITATDSKSELAKAARESLNGRHPFHWAVEFPEVLSRGGFDAFVGNPPFQGGKKISSSTGSDYREFLVRVLASDRKGNADLSAYFILRANILLGDSGMFGLIATNSICQGETREVGLDQLVTSGQIIRAVPNMIWPGTANVCIAVFWFRRGEWAGERRVFDSVVTGIASDLNESSTVKGIPLALVSSSQIAFLGSNPRGAGFFLSPQEADEFITADQKNAECIEEFLIGEDLMNSPNHKPSRFIINFRDWDENQARQYPLLFKRCETLVLPKRREIPHKQTREKCVRYFWRYDALAKGLYEAIRGMRRVLATAQVSPTNAVTWIVRSGTFDKKIVAFAVDESHWFGLFQSSIFWEWVRKNTATLGGSTLNFSPSDCVTTLPIPPPVNLASLTGVSEIYFNERRRILEVEEIGLTDFYNRFHNEAVRSADVESLRALQVALDNAVAAAYGWSDLDLGHGFHATKQGERYTISEPARRTVLDRLLALNHQRHAEEVAAGLHDKKAKKTASADGNKQKGRKPKVSVIAGAARQLPTEFRLSATEPQLYSINLVVSLLSEAGGSLPWPRLLDAFVLATQPKLLVKFAEQDDKPLAKEWAERWSEAATPEMLMPSLRQLAASLAVEDTDEGLTFALQDGPRNHATEDVGFDAWIALRVTQLLAPEAISILQRQEWTTQAKALAVA